MRKTSDDCTVTPGEPEKPAKPSEPENPTKPEDPSKPTTPETRISRIRETAVLPTAMIPILPAVEAPTEEQRAARPASGFRTQRAGGIAEQTVPGRRVSGSSWDGMA